MNAYDGGLRERELYLVPYEFDEATTLYGDLKSVIDHHDRAKAQFDSRYLRALYDLRSGVLLHMAWTMAKVMSHYAESMAISPHQLAGLQLLNASLGGLDPLTDALKYLQSAAQQEPNLAEVHYHRGLIFAVRGKHDEAVVAFREAISSTPAIITALQDISFEARASFYCGKALEQLKQAEQALAYYERAIALVPDFPDAHRRCAELLRACGQFQAAAVHFDKAMVYRPVLPTLPKMPARIAPAGQNGAVYAPKLHKEFDKTGQRKVLKLLRRNEDGLDIGYFDGCYYAIPTGDSDLTRSGIEQERYPLMLRGITEDELTQKIHRYKNEAHLVETGYRAGFNIFKLQSSFHAVFGTIEAFELAKARAGGYAVWLSGDNLAGIKAQIDAMFAAPELIEQGYRGYNLCRVGPLFCAILQSEGVFAVERLRHGSGAYSSWFISNTYDDLRKQVSQATRFAVRYRPQRVMRALHKRTPNIAKRLVKKVYAAFPETAKRPIRRVRTWVLR